MSAKPYISLNKVTPLICVSIFFASFVLDCSYFEIEKSKNHHEVRLAVLIRESPSGGL